MLGPKRIPEHLHFDLFGTPTAFGRLRLSIRFLDAYEATSWAPNRQNVIKHNSCFIDFLNRSGRLLVPVCAPEGSLRPPQRSSKGRPGRPEGSQGPPEAPPRSPDTPRAPSGPCQDPLWAHRGTLLDPRKLMLESLRPFLVPFAIDFGTIYLYTSRLYRAGAAKRQQIFLVCLLVVYDCLCFI